MRNTIIQGVLVLVLASTGACKPVSPSTSPALGTADGSGTTAVAGSGTTADGAGTTTVGSGTTADANATGTVATVVSAPAAPAPATAESATKLIFTSAPLSQTAGACGLLTIQTQDGTGAPVGLVNARTISFTSNTTTGTFYSDSACTMADSSLTISAGGNGGSIYFADSALGTPAIQASDAFATPLTAATQTESILDPATASGGTATPSLNFTNAALVQSTSSCGVLTLSVHDGSGATAALTTALQVSFASTSATGSFYADAACTTSLVNASLPAGLSTATIYYKDTTAGAPTVLATSSDAAYRAANQSETISTPAGMSTIDFNSLHAQSYVNRCIAIPLSIHNSSGLLSYFVSDVTIGLSTSTLYGSFYVDSGCSNRITWFTIKNGHPISTLYYMSLQLGQNALFVVPPQGSGIAATLQYLNLYNE